jgi:hypothetical protein
VHNSADSVISNSTGDLYIINSADDKDVIFQSDDGSGGTTEYFRLDGSDGYMVASKAIRALDSVNLQLGASADFTMQHNGSNTVLQNFTGDLQITQGADDKDIIFQGDNGSGGTTEYFRLDGSATLINVSCANGMQFNDNVRIKVGSGSGGDLRIYHDGSNSYIDETGSGGLYIRANSFLTLQKYTGENMAQFFADGSVRLYYDNVKKLETAAAGVKTTYAATSNTDGDAAGDIVNLGETTTVAGKIYYYTSSGAWELADADAESTAKGMLGVALGTSSGANGMLLRGMVTLDHDPGTIADTLFLSTTAGAATATAPSGTGDIVRVIGYCLNSTNGQIYFNPDGAFVEVTAG